MSDRELCNNEINGHYFLMLYKLTVVVVVQVTNSLILVITLLELH